MIAVSQAFATQIEQDTRTFSARFLLIDNGTETELTGSVRRLTMGKGTGAEAEFGVGTLYSNNIEAEFWRCETPLQNATLAVELGVQLPDGSFEYVRAGVFDITRVSTDAYSTIVIGYGPLTTKFGGTYTGTGDKSIAAILADVQAETGCTIDAGAFPAATTALHPAREMTGLTHREVVAYIAGLLGGYVTETASGTVVMQAMPTAVSMAVDADRSTQLASFNDYDFTVAGILVDAGFASGSPNVTLANPYMTQALFDRLVSELVGYTYRPGTVSLSLGDIRLEAGDLLEVTDLNGVAYHVPCLNIVHTFDGGLSTLVTAPGESELQTMANTTGAMQRAVNTAQTTATEAKGDAADARKVATNYISFDSASGLCICDQSAQDANGNPTGANVLITNSGFEVRMGTDVLASYGSNAIYLGRNSADTVINLVNGRGIIQNVDMDDDGELRSKLALKSGDTVCIEGDKRASLYSDGGNGFAFVSAETEAYNPWDEYPEPIMSRPVATMRALEYTSGVTGRISSNIDVKADSIQMTVADVEDVLKVDSDGVQLGVKPLIFSNGLEVRGKTSNGIVIPLLSLSTNNNTVLGYGGYTNSIGRTKIYGTDILFMVGTPDDYVNLYPYYKFGDTVTGHIKCAGFITSASKGVRFSVPLGRPVIGKNLNVLADALTIRVRQGNKYLYGSSSNTMVEPAAIVCELEFGSVVNITATMDNATNVVSNNDACGIEANITLQFM